MHYIVGEPDFMELRVLRAGSLDPAVRVYRVAVKDLKFSYNNRETLSFTKYPRTVTSSSLNSNPVKDLRVLGVQEGL